MKRTVCLPEFWKLALAQLAIAVALATVIFYFDAKAFLAGPPSGDVYANNWGFQIVAFLIFWLPALLVLMSLLLAIEWLALQPFYARQRRSDARGEGQH